MNIILAQRIDYASDYEDIPFEQYHFPKRYRNRIRSGDTFIYYQGNRHSRDQRCYFGFGIIGKISIANDGEHYYARILDGQKLATIVPIYNPDGGFFESLGFQDVRDGELPSWRNS